MAIIMTLWIGNGAALTEKFESMAIKRLID